VGVVHIAWRRTMSEFEKQLIRHEGKKLFPYVDTIGKLTIGVDKITLDRI